RKALDPGPRSWRLRNMGRVASPPPASTQVVETRRRKTRVGCPPQPPGQNKEKIMLNQTSPRNSLSNLLVIIAAIAVFAAGFAITRILTTTQPQTAPSASENPASGGAAIVNPPHRLQDFTLTSHTGEPVSLSDFRGKAVLLLFGYTNCPDVCPGTLAEFVRVKRELGARAADVAFVLVSVDRTSTRLNSSH